MLVIARDAAVNAAAAVGSLAGGHRIVPSALNDGRYAVPQSLSTDPNYAAAASYLSGGSIETPAGTDYRPVPSATSGDGQFLVYVDNKAMSRLGPPSALTAPAPNVFRFAPPTNAGVPPGDSANGNRRSEIQSIANDRTFFAGDILWSAFSLILGDHDGLSAVTSNTFGLVHQWHSVDVVTTRSPVFGIDCSNNVMTIFTRSSAEMSGSSGVLKGWYSAAIPAKGVVTNFAIQGTLGPTGHLNVWANGTQIINVNTPIGYYDDASGLGLAYPQWGLYTRNRREPDIAYIANPEWGLTSLSARVASPLSVPALTW